MAYGKQMKMAIILAATDKMSRVVNAAFRNAEKRLKNVQRRSNEIARNAGQWARQTAIMGTAVAAPLALAANEAIKFEDAMAGVSKTTGLAQGSAELTAIGNSVKDVAVTLAKTPDQVAELYASLAQGGAPKTELSKIAELAGKVGVAFDIDPGIAGERFIKLSNAMGITIEQTKNAADAINFLSDNSAAKASQILDFFGAGGAGASRAMGLMAQEGAALASVYISMGKRGEESSTIVERMTKVLRNQDKAAGKVFQSAGGGLAGLLAAIEKGKSLKGAERFAFFKQFGEYGVEVEQLANNSALLQKQLALVSEEANYANSVQKEFANRSNTTAFRLAQAQANAKVFAIEVGTNLLPAITDILKDITPVVKSMIEWARANPQLVTTIAKVAAGVAALSYTLSAISTIIAGVSGAVSILSGALAFLAANPVVLIIAGVAALAAGIVYLWKNSEGFRGTLVGIWEWLKGLADLVKNYVINQVAALGKILVGIATFNPAKIASGVSEAISNVKNAWTGMGALKGNFTAGYDKGASMYGGAKAPAVNTPNRKVAPVNQQSSLSVNFAPSVNVQGGTAMDKKQFMDGLKQYEPELLRLIKEGQRKENRLAY